MLTNLCPRKGGIFFLNTWIIFFFVKFKKFILYGFLGFSILKFSIRFYYCIHRKKNSDAKDYILFIETYEFHFNI